MNAWLCPWCFSCASKHFNIPRSTSGQTTWEHMAREIREKTLAPSTIKAYQKGFNYAEWPLDSPFRVMAYLDKAPASDASLKQWMATAMAIHKSRLWDPPDFNNPLVQNFIQALKRRSTVQRTTFNETATFSENDLRLIFACLKQNREPTDKRNWAIAVTQLFGVRRASEVLALRAKDIYIAEGTLVIRIPSSKTDKRKKGIFFKLPQTSVFGFNPAEILATYLLGTKGNGEVVFPSFDPNSKKFTTNQISLNGWNRAIKRLCLRAKINPRTSHAFRRSAITLSPIELVEAVAQTGGWRSLCFWEVYRKFDIDQRAIATAQIGKRTNIHNERVPITIPF